MAHETILHQWFEEVWNQGRESVVHDLWAEGVVTQGLSSPAGDHVTGPTSFLPFYRQLRTAFPDIHFTIEDTLAGGDRIMARCRVTGTHSGPGITAVPSNKTFAITGMCLVRVKHDKIIEAWNNFDFLSLHRQLGLPLQ